MLRHVMFTGLLITILILAGVATAIGGGLVVAQRRRELSGGAGKSLSGGADGRQLARTIRDLRPGDVLTFDGKDFLVEGVMSYDEEGHRWLAGRVVDGRDQRWIVVGLERGGPLTVRILASDSETDMSGYPPEVLIAGQTRYNMDKRGTATARATGETGLSMRGDSVDAVERCRWWLYETPGDDTLLVEQWGDTFRVLRGKKVNPALVDLIAGS